MSAKYTFWAWEQETGSHTAKLVLLKLADNANDDGISWYPISKMLTACELSDRAFRNQLRKLEELGLLAIEHRDNRPSVYALPPDLESVRLNGTRADSASRAVPPAPNAGTPARGAGTPAPSAADLNKILINNPDTDTDIFKDGSFLANDRTMTSGNGLVTGSWSGDNTPHNLTAIISDQSDKSVIDKLVGEVSDMLEMGTGTEALYREARRAMMRKVGEGHGSITHGQLGDQIARLGIGIERRAGRDL
ncbi:helix-turn-helix domain-containing protein [Aeromonas rivipollensis]|uniref:helix-turn-helix domain-containing protein n=1 Tax=Aeromonas rivipollensis TaxID=948519 RepID=UPI003D1F0FAC